MNFWSSVTSRRSEQGTSCISQQDQEPRAPGGEPAHPDASKPDRVSPEGCRRSLLVPGPDSGQVAPPGPGKGGSLPVPWKKKWKVTRGLWKVDASLNLSSFPKNTVFSGL